MVDTREYLKETQNMNKSNMYTRVSLKYIDNSYTAYLLLGLVLFPNGLLRERLRLAEGLVQRDDALSEMREQILSLDGYIIRWQQYSCMLLSRPTARG